jgi:hypothetical protein
VPASGRASRRRRLDDPTAARILRTDPAAAPDWAGSVAVHTTRAGETTSGVMRHLSRALAGFSHQTVVTLCSTPPAQSFQIADILTANGTMCLLGGETSLAAMAPLLTAFALGLPGLLTNCAAQDDTTDARVLAATGLS